MCDCQFIGLIADKGPDVETVPLEEVGDDDPIPPEGYIEFLTSKEENIL